MAGVTPAPRICRSCGRRIEWRRKWERNWHEIAYCSDACRSRKVMAVDRELESRILSLLESGSAASSVSPADAARAVFAASLRVNLAGVADAEAADGWRVLLEPARRAARRLVASGAVEIIQHGRVVDPSTARGDFLIRRR